MQESKATLDLHSDAAVAFTIQLQFFKVQGCGKLSISCDIHLSTADLFLLKMNAVSDSWAGEVYAATGYLTTILPSDIPVAA